METKNKRKGRPPIAAPDGWVTIRTAAEHCGVSYAVVARHVRQNLIMYQRLAPGNIILIAVDSLHNISARVPRPPAERARVVVQLSPRPERHAEWAREAAREGCTVTELAYRLLDDAAAEDKP